MIRRRDRPVPALYRPRPQRSADSCEDTFGPKHPPNQHLSVSEVSGLGWNILDFQLCYALGLEIGGTVKGVQNHTAPPTWFHRLCDLHFRTHSALASNRHFSKLALKVARRWLVDPFPLGAPSKRDLPAFVRMSCEPSWKINRVWHACFTQDDSATVWRVAIVVSYWTLALHKGLVHVQSRLAVFSRRALREQSANPDFRYHDLFWGRSVMLCT